MIWRQLRPALVLFATLAAIAGLVYPFAITGLAQAIFPHQANGSLVLQNGKVIGSELIGQQFSDPRYFWGRLSATSGQPYNASSSGGSNYSVLNANLEKQVQDRLVALKAADPANQQPVPVDLVTASGSGLDPDISLAAAKYQAPRVARLRGLSEEVVDSLIVQYTQRRILGVFGEPCVNVLKLNLALDALQ